MKIILSVLALALAGCVNVQYRDPQTGREFKYSAPAFGVKTIKSVNLQTGVLEGYSSEQSQMVDFLRAMYDAGVSRGIGLAKP